MEIWKEPWQPLSKPSPNLVAELARELASNHPLFNKKVKAIALGWNGDDVLYELVDEHRYAVVHLTWSARVEADNLPHTVFYDSLADFCETALNKDHDDYLQMG